MGKLKKWAIHSLGRAISVVCVLLIIGLIGYSIYVALIQPHTKHAVKTQEQKADKITNITQLKEEEAFELSLIPPKIKIGGLKIKIFDFK